MIELGAASEDDVVLAFLRAEIDSPKWGPLYSRALEKRNLDRASLVDAADLNDARACVARKDVVGDVRGYGRGSRLFYGFPLDTTWRRVEVEPSDFPRLKSISGDDRWDKLTGGTRLIQDAAGNLDTYPERAELVRTARERIEPRAERGEAMTARSIRRALGRAPEPPEPRHLVEALRRIERRAHSPPTPCPPGNTPGSCP